MRIIFNINYASGILSNSCHVLSPSLYSLHLLIDTGWEFRSCVLWTCLGLNGCSCWHSAKQFTYPRSFTKLTPYSTHSNANRFSCFSTLTEDLLYHFWVWTWCVYSVAMDTSCTLLTHCLIYIWNRIPCMEKCLIWHWNEHGPEIWNLTPEGNLLYRPRNSSINWIVSLQLYAILTSQKYLANWTGFLKWEREGGV